MNIRFSDAIRLGAMLKPQGFGLGQQRRGESCANIAAMEATGNKIGISVLVAFPHLKDVVVCCPVCRKSYENLGAFSENFGGLTAHMNDVHRLSREEIADFVEAIEAQHAPQPVADREAVEVGA